MAKVVFEKCPPIFTLEDLHARNGTCVIRNTQTDKITIYDLNTKETGDLKRAMACVGHITLTQSPEFLFDPEDAYSNSAARRLATIVAKSTEKNTAIVVTARIKTMAGAQKNHARPKFHFNNRVFDAEFVGSGSSIDSSADIEFYLVHNIDASFQCIELVDRDIPRKGDDVLLIGWSIGFSSNNIKGYEYLGMKSQDSQVSQITSMFAKLYYITDGVSYFEVELVCHYESRTGGPIVNENGQMIGVMQNRTCLRDPIRAVYSYHVETKLGELCGAFNMDTNQVIKSQEYVLRPVPLVNFSMSLKEFLKSVRLVDTIVSWNDSDRHILTKGPSIVKPSTVYVSAFGEAIYDVYYSQMEGYNSNCIIKHSNLEDNFVQKTTDDVVLIVNHRGVLEPKSLTDILRGAPEYYRCFGLNQPLGNGKAEKVKVSFQATVLRSGTDLTPFVFPAGKKDVIIIEGTGLGSSPTFIDHRLGGRVPCKQPTRDGTSYIAHSLCPVDSDMSVQDVRKETAQERLKAELKDQTTDMPWGVVGHTGNTNFDLIIHIYVPVKTVRERRRQSTTSTPYFSSTSSAFTWAKWWFAEKTPEINPYTKEPTRFEEGLTKPNAVETVPCATTRARLGFGRQITKIDDLEDFPDFERDSEIKVVVTILSTVHPSAKEPNPEELKAITDRLTEMYKGKGMTRTDHLQQFVTKGFLTSLRVS